MVTSHRYDSLRPNRRRPRTLDGGVHAEAIVDRIVQVIVWLEGGGRQHARHIRLTVLNGHRQYQLTVPPMLSRNIHGTEMRNY